jgi:DNA polymerase III subunit delta
LTGENGWGRAAELDKLAASFVAEYGDMALERFDGEETPAERMRESLQSLPFLTARKMVVLRGASKQKAFAENIGDILKNMAETTDLVLVEPKLDKRLGYYKTLKKETDFREFGEMDVSGLARWAVEYAKGRGGSLGSGDARLLIERLGLNQQLLKSELDKLLAYNEQISRSTIELLTEKAPQSTIFELLDAAFAGKTKHALELYKEQRALKVEPQDILAMLAWQLHILAAVKAGAAKPADEIARVAKLNPFVVRKSQALVRARSLADLKTMIADLLDLDVALKRSAIDPDESLELYLIKLAN